MNCLYFNISYRFSQQFYAMIINKAFGYDNVVK